MSDTLVGILLGRHHFDSGVLGLLRPGGYRVEAGNPTVHSKEEPVERGKD